MSFLSLVCWSSQKRPDSCIRDSRKPGGDLSRVTTVASRAPLARAAPRQPPAATPPFPEVAVNATPHRSAPYGRRSLPFHDGSLVPSRSPAPTNNHSTATATATASVAVDLSSSAVSMVAVSPSGGGGAASADDDLRRDPSPSSSSRRLPPPCWTHEETGALIQSYSQKWHALQRGNLRAVHWEEVAGAVADRCRPLYAAAHPAGNRPKTAVQCRHKMEKLRKRYRSERRRHHRSSWVHFPQMHAMEMGVPLIRGSGGGADLSKAAVATAAPPTHIDDDDAAGALRFQITKALSATSPGAAVNGRGEQLLPPAAGGEVRRRKERAGGVPLLGEMAAAVRTASDGFLRAEETTMAAAREMEKQKMQTELRRTEMMIETQNRVVNAFISGFSRSKKKRPSVDPEA